jgi:hypothetical protein
MSGIRDAVEQQVATLVALTRVPYWIVRRSGAAPFLANTRVRFEALTRAAQPELEVRAPRASVLVRVQPPGAPESLWLGRVDPASGALVAQPEPPSPLNAATSPRPALRVRWRPVGQSFGAIDGELLAREPAATGTWSGDPGGDRRAEHVSP